SRGCFSSIGLLQLRGRCPRYAARGVPQTRCGLEGTKPALSRPWLRLREREVEMAETGGIVPKYRTGFALATAMLIAVGCAHGFESSASGEVIDAAAAAKTVVLHVDNQNPQSMELRTVLDGRSTFVGSVGGSDSTSILLDPTMFPAGFLYVVAVPADGRGRAI